MTISGKTVDLFPAAVPGAPLVVVNGEGDEGRRLYDRAREMTEAPFSLALIGGIDWDAELTPWPAPAAFRGGSDFAGRADAYLDSLTGEIVPRVVAALGAEPVYAALAGYSLAGLFSLYALYRTDAFARAASVSGSLWYPGFLDYVRAHAWKRRPDCLYLSVGDREGNTRNPVMKPVEANTRAAAVLFEQTGVPTAFGLNPGGHFNDPEGRTARGIAWLLEQG